MAHLFSVQDLYIVGFFNFLMPFNKNFHLEKDKFGKIGGLPS